MVARSPVRYLAPIVLVATIAGAYLIVHHGTARHGPSVASKRPISGAHAAPRNRFAQAKLYVVRPGDNLSTIAARVRVALATLEALNPAVDPNSLQAGQRIRLRR